MDVTPDTHTAVDRDCVSFHPASESARAEEHTQRHGSTHQWELCACRNTRLQMGRQLAHGHSLTHLTLSRGWHWELGVLSARDNHS